MESCGRAAGQPAKVSLPPNAFPLGVPINEHSADKILFLDQLTFVRDKLKFLSAKNPLSNHLISSFFNKIEYIICKTFIRLLRRRISGKTFPPRPRLSVRGIPPAGRQTSRFCQIRYDKLE